MSGMPCHCGDPDACWHGPEDGLREYMCDSCWGRMLAVLLEKAEIRHEILPEDMPPEEGFSFDEDIAACRALLRTTPWGWCCVKTTATIYDGQGNRWAASTFLGGCCYESEQAFVASEGETQAVEACVMLLAELEAQRRRGLAAEAMAGIIRRAAR